MSNKALIALLTSHNIFLQRLNTGAVNHALETFDAVSQPKLARLEKMLGNLTDSELKLLSGGQYKTERLKKINSFINDWQKEISSEIKAVFNSDGEALAAHEMSFAQKLDQQPAKSVKMPTAAAVYSSSVAAPYAGGALIQNIFPSIANKLRVRLEMVIRDGISNGLTNQQIVRQIKGTKVNKFKDGMLDELRRHIDSEVRTARAHISNDAYVQTWQALGYKFVRIVATLDGRTTVGCAALDGRVYPINADFRKPPYHYNCRTVLIGCDKDGNIAGMRPFVADDRPVKDIPKDQRKGKIGQVDANTTYSEWFKEQPEWLQKEVLGASRFKLYKDGGFPINKFVDFNHKLITLEELSKLDDNLFKELGITIPTRRIQ